MSKKNERIVDKESNQEECMEKIMVTQIHSKKHILLQVGILAYVDTLSSLHRMSTASRIRLFCSDKLLLTVCI